MAIIIMFILACSLVALIFALHYYYRELNNKNQVLTRVWDILNTHSDAWYAWSRNEKFVNCSANFPRLFNLPDNTPPETINILDYFEAEDSQQVYSALESLINYSTPFNIEVQLNNSDNPDTKFICIKGEPLWPPAGDGFVLWVSRRTTNTAVTAMLPSPAADPDFSQGLSRLNKIMPESQLLAQRMNWYEALLNHSPIPMWVRTQDSNLVFCNSLYADLLRSDPDTALKQNLKLFPFNRLSLSKKTAAGDSLTLQSETATYNRIVNGQNHIFNIHEMPIQNNHLIGYAIDVTELTLSKKAIENNMDSYQRLINSVPVPLAMLHSSLRFKFCNHAYQTLYELDDNWIAKTPHINEFLDELRTKRMLPEHADFRSYKQAQVEILSSLKSSQQEIQYLPNGKTLRILWSPAGNDYLIMAIEDVSDKINLERRYNTIIEVNKQVLTNLCEGIFIVGSDHRVSFMNSAFCRIWDIKNTRPDTDFHITDILDLMHKYFEDAQEGENFKSKIMTHLRDRMPCSYQVIRGDGSAVRFNYLPLPDGDHFFGYTDITDSRQVEQAIRERNAALMSASRIKSDFIHNLASQLHPVLDSLLHNSKTLEEIPGDDQNKLQDYANTSRTVYDNTNRLLSIINELMKNVSFDTVNLFKTEFNLQTMVQTIVTKLNPLAEAQGVSLSCHGADSAMLLYSDDQLIQQSLEYLIQNGLQYCDVGGHVDIEIKDHVEEIIIRISDTGTGLPQEIIEGIMKESRHDNYYEIRGSNIINLPTIKRIFELHGGKMDIIAAPGMGTSICLTLPKYALIADLQPPQKRLA